MDGVLLEKAETQQSLVLLRKDNEKAKQQARVRPGLGETGVIPISQACLWI